MSAPSILILGIGNLLWADEGFGVRCVEQLHSRYEFPANVSLLDGGTQGIYLVQHVQSADILVVFDAIDYGLPAGTMKIIRDDEVPKFMGAKKMSLHQTGFQEVLAMAEFTGHYPSELLLVGVQPEALEDFGGSLRESVRAQIDPALAVVLAFLAERGVVAKPRQSATTETLSPDQLQMGLYEDGRPDAGQACRHGDIRFIPPTAGVNS